MSENYHGSTAWSHFSVAIGEKGTFRVPENYLRLRGLELVLTDSPECLEMARDSLI